MITERTAPQTPADETDFINAPPKRATVTFWLIATFLLLGAILAFLLYRAIVFEEPRHVLTIRGGLEWVGSSIVVTDQNSSRRWGAFLDQSGNRTVSFFVPAGRYTLEVATAQGEPCFRETFDMTKKREAEFFLPTTAPASQPATDTSKS